MPETQEERANRIEDTCFHACHGSIQEPAVPDVNNPNHWCVCICLACYDSTVKEIRDLAWKFLKEHDKLSADGMGFLHEIFRVCDETLKDGGIKE